MKEKRIATNSELKAEENKIAKQAFHSSYFCYKTHFKDAGTQVYLVFQPVLNYFKENTNTDHISA